MVGFHVYVGTANGFGVFLAGGGVMTTFTTVSRGYSLFQTSTSTQLTIITLLCVLKFPVFKHHQTKQKCLLEWVYFIIC